MQGILCCRGVTSGVSDVNVSKPFARVSVCVTLSFLLNSPCIMINIAATELNIKLRLQNKC